MTWKKPVIKDGVIIEGGFGAPIDWYSEEAKEQRRKEIRRKQRELRKDLEDIEQGFTPVSPRD